jgi:tRNA threonylcarbamoyladenosine biosynthesis protein TsaE
MKTLQQRSASAEETHEIGRRLGQLLRPGDVLLLTGELGSGKTCLTQGIGEGMGIEDPIKSSSFVLMNEYPAGAPLYHADLYRLTDPAEVADLSLEEYATPGVLVVEWPERAWDELPDERLLVRMTYEGEEERGLEFEAHGARYEALLDRFEEGERG